MFDYKEITRIFGFQLQVINYDSPRGGVSVITEKGDVTTSFLLIQHAETTDSGKYSCSPSNADVASVRVHVLNGKCKYVCAVVMLWYDFINNAIVQVKAIPLFLLGRHHFFCKITSSLQR